MAVASKLSFPASDSYDAQFANAESSLPGAAHGWLRDLRARSFARFREQGFPTQKVEEWKYTGLSRLAREDGFVPALPAPLDEAQVRPHLIGDAIACLVFVNGHLSPALSRLEAAIDGVRIGSLGEALAAAETPLADLVGEDEDARSLSALNAAFMADGAMIEVAAGAKPAGPIQLVFVATRAQGPQMANPRNLIALGEGAEAHVVETHLALGEGTHFCNLVQRIRVAADARLVHDRLQLGAPGWHMIGRSELEIGDRGVIEQTLATLGGDLVRNETRAWLNGEHIVLHLNGAYLPRGSEHVDNQIWIEHIRPHSESNQFYKGVLDEKARAVFAGKISVRQAAQKTNAFQANDNLLLSGDAEIDTKPELEIFADDVKCSHGATAGELDERELFYLRSRGLDAQTARSLLTYAFTGEVIERFGHEQVKTQVRRALRHFLPGIEALEGVEP